jgi:hypothetical protein
MVQIRLPPAPLCCQPGRKPGVGSLAFRDYVWRGSASYATQKAAGSSEHGDLIKQEDRARHLAALDELPNNAPSPRVFYVSIYDQDIEPHWRVTFTLDHTAHETSLRLPTEAAATEYASSFLASWAKMSGR